jgi:hypothetical protein
MPRSPQKPHLSLMPRSPQKQEASSYRDARKRAPPRQSSDGFSFLKCLCCHSGRQHDVQASYHVSPGVSGHSGRYALPFENQFRPKTIPKTCVPTPMKCIRFPRKWLSRLASQHLCRRSRIRSARIWADRPTRSLVFRCGSFNVYTGNYPQCLLP